MQLTHLYQKLSTLQMLTHLYLKQPSLSFTDEKLEAQNIAVVCPAFTATKWWSWSLSSVWHRQVHFPTLPSSPTYLLLGVGRRRGWDKTWKYRERKLSHNPLSSPGDQFSTGSLGALYSYRLPCFPLLASSLESCIYL